MTSTSSRFTDYVARTEPGGPAHALDGRWAATTCAIPTRSRRRAASSSSVNDMANWMTMVLANGSLEGADRRPQGAAARADPAVGRPAAEPAMRPGFYGFGFNVGMTRRAARVQPLRRLRPRRGTNFRSCLRRTWRSSRSATPRRPAWSRRSPPSSWTWCSSARSARTGTRSTRTPSRMERRWARWPASTRRRTRRPPRHFGVRRHLCQRLLGPGSGHRGGRQAGVGFGPQTGCSAGALGRQHLHLQHGDRELAPRQHLQGDVRR